MKNKVRYCFVGDKYCNAGCDMRLIIAVGDDVEVQQSDIVQECKLRKGVVIYVGQTFCTVQYEDLGYTSAWGGKHSWTESFGTLDFLNGNLQKTA